MITVRKSSAMQFETVIFATDFSPASYNAGLYASAISIHFSTSLVVVHTFTLLQAALEVETGKSIPSQQRIDLGCELTLTAETLKAGRGTTETVLLEGDPRHRIPALAQRKAPALVVLGTHGRGAVDRFVLGSTSEGVLKHSSEPALTVGPNVSILRAGPLLIRRILYATDCSTEAAHTAPVSIALAEAFSADLDVLNVIHSSEVDHPEQIRHLQQHFYGAVEAIMPHRAGQLCEPHTFVSVGKPPTEILKHIRECEIDLLILGLRRNTHLGMQNRTSGAFRIIAEANCPVITVASGNT